MKKIVLLAFVLVLLSTAVIVRVRPVVTQGTIYIRSDGSVDPPTAPIEKDGNVYTFTDNIYDSIVVERSNILIDGNGYILQGSGSGRGFSLYNINNVTIKNTNIEGFYWGVHLNSTSYNVLSRNNITNNGYCGILLYSSSDNSLSGNNIASIWVYSLGIWLQSSSSNTVSGNNITNNYYGIVLEDSSNYNSIFRNNLTDNHFGIWLSYSSNNIICGNNITANDNSGIRLFSSSNSNGIYGNNIINNAWGGIDLSESSSNTVSGNNITNNYLGIWLYNSSNNKFYHNNFIDNIHQVYIETSGYANFLDDGYPSGGNYWSDYEGVDYYSGPHQNVTGSDGIGDAPYILDADNHDNYPLMSPWSPIEEASLPRPFWMQWWFWTIVAAGIIVLAVAVYFLKERKSPTPTAPT